MNAPRFGQAEEGEGGKRLVVKAFLFLSFAFIYVVGRAVKREEGRSNQGGVVGVTRRSHPTRFICSGMRQ